MKKNKIAYYKNSLILWEGFKVLKLAKGSNIKS